MNPSAPLAVRLAVTVTGAVLLLFGVFRVFAEPRNLDASIGVLLSGAFAALPWIALDRPDPRRGVLGAVAALALFLCALLPLQPGRVYPLQCGPVDFACQLDDALHGVGGAPLAMLPPLLLAVLLFVKSVRTLRADLQIARK